jgi:Zn-dependent protease
VFRSRLFPRFAARLLGEEALPAGSVLGTLVDVHPSAFFTAVVIGVSLGTHVVPRLHPAQPAPVLWAASAALTFGFFVSLLAHELGHALAARTIGIRATRIRFWLLGGVTKLASAPRRPTDDSRVALGGPVASFVSACLLLGASFSLGTWEPTRSLAASFALLALANALLAGLNLLPAFPLDGGRVYRALLWRVGGSRPRATRIAAHGGGLFGAAAVLVGIVALLRGSAVGWALIALGWTVGESAGRAEEIALGEEAAEIERLREAARRAESAITPVPDRIRLTAAGTYAPESSSTARIRQAKRPRAKSAASPARPPSTPKSPPDQSAAAGDDEGSTSSNRPDSE